MKILRAPDYRVMPWKNGGGTTTELYVFPEDAGLTGQSFQWRVSIADVIRDGPFSRFEGYDRQIMLLDGKGMILEGGPQGPIDVSAGFQPRRFSGDWDIFGRLTNGAVRDFNMITRRADCTGRLHVEIPEALKSFRPGPALTFIHILAGRYKSDGNDMETGYSVLLSPFESLTLMPVEIRSLLAVCEFTRRDLSPPPGKAS